MRPTPTLNTLSKGEIPGYIFDPNGDTPLSQPTTKSTYKSPIALTSPPSPSTTTGNVRKSLHMNTAAIERLHSITPHPPPPTPNDSITVCITQ